MDPETERKRAIRGGNFLPNKNYPIAPKDIDPVRIGDVLGKNETEGACRKLVEGLQRRGQGWGPFTLSEVGLTKDYPGFADLERRRLVIGWVGNGAVGKEDTFLVSHILVSLLFENAPAWEVVSTDGTGD